MLYMLKRKSAVKNSSKSLGAAEEEKEAMVVNEVGVYDWSCSNVSVSTQS